ncbi:LacI family DNA-binding transcriptional regulator [Ensifer sp. ENS11]|uniref:LacI family DNA-binding transcriptional regulator n=1 Tax=Ensifer sp. ENS11 TaxID=2769291 RepID=UPI002811CDBE|nr:LacI family DNA-binding transcriptional regulator [Ensifer sp. ENS11]
MKDDITSKDQSRKASRRGSGRPTIADVAKLAGVAAITVSRALRDPSLVSAELRAEIDTAVIQLGYAPDPNARALASSRADVIGVLVPSLTNIVFADTVRGIYDELGDGPLQIQMGNTHYSPREEERLIRMFLSQRPSALIVSGIDQTETTRKLLESADCPIVQIMEYGDDPVDMLVGFSHFDGGKAATNHLIEAGYRRIGFIGARMDPRSQRRLAGYRSALETAQLFDPKLVTTTLTPSRVSLGGPLLADALAKVADLDAVFCNNDDLAMGVLFECQRAGIAVPHSMAICGFNDLDMMHVAYPSLTSVRTPRYEIGRRSVQMVLDRLAGRPIESPVVDLGFELQVRESTAR